MKIIFPKKVNPVISPSIKKEIKREIGRVLTKYFGRHISTLPSVALTHPTNPKFNGYAIYTEAEDTTKEINLEHNDPKIIFQEMMEWETNYFFGFVQTKISGKKFFFLADVQHPIPAGKEYILLDGIREIRVFVKHY